MDEELTPERVFAEHYKGTPNPMTPQVVELGWVVDGMIAFELSRNTEGDLWGLTLVAWDEGMTLELEAGRWAGFTEAEGRAAIQQRKLYYGGTGTRM